MNRFLAKFNLVGVIAMAGLCVFQWKANREVHTEVIRLQKHQQEQNAKSAEQQKTIADQSADLETFRAQLVAEKKEQKDLRTKLADLDRVMRQSAAEAEQLKSSLTNWVAAVNERDKQLEKTAVDLKAVVEARDEAIDKYNALAKTHNQLVADLNRAATNTAAKN